MISSEELQYLFVFHNFKLNQLYYNIKPILTNTRICYIDFTSNLY